MVYAAAIFGGAWVCWSLLQLLLAGYAARVFNRQLSRPDSNQASVAGRVAILLAVRGSDPSFGDCVDSLLAQDHSDFEIHVILDSRKDSAWAVAESRQASSPDGKIFVHELETPQMTCGLKCSALNFGISKVSSNVRFFAFVDSDVVVHSSWLTEMLEPLADESIGVTTGNQWFEPSSPSLGSMLRSVWHAGAIVPAIMYYNPWAGSMAMRQADFETSGLAEYWRSSVVDDGPVREAFDAIGKRIELVSTVTLINRESCSAGYTVRYVRRMLTWAKLYDETYSRTVIHALITGVLLLGTILISLASILPLFLGYAQRQNSLAVGVVALFLGMVFSLVGYLIVRSPIRRLHDLRGTPLGRLGPGRIVWLLFLMPVTQILYACSLIAALFTKHVRWRDATYQLNSKTDIRLLDYKPYLRDESSNSSII